MFEKSVLIAFVFCLAGTIQAFTQNQRIGFIDSGVIMDQMPEYAGIEQRLNLLSESWRDEINEMDSNINAMEEDFEAREVLFTDEVRAQRLAEIENAIAERDSFVDQRFGPDGEYFQRQRELLEPVQRQIFDAVNRIAVREEFDFIFDRARDVRFLHANPDWNLTQVVLEELGLNTNQQGN